MNPDDPVKELEDGRGVFLHPMLFGKFRLYVGDVDALVYDDGW